MKKIAKTVLRMGIPIPKFIKPVIRLMYKTGIVVCEGLVFLRKVFFVEPVLRSVAQVGKRLRADRLPYIRGKGKLIIGDNVRLSGRSCFYFMRGGDGDILTTKHAKSTKKGGGDGDLFLARSPDLEYPSAQRRSNPDGDACLSSEDEIQSQSCDGTMGRVANGDGEGRLRDTEADCRPQTADQRSEAGRQKVGGEKYNVQSKKNGDAGHPLTPETLNLAPLTSPEPAATPCSMLYAPCYSGSTTEQLNNPTTGAREPIIEIGDGTFIGNGCTISCARGVRIGKDVLISAGVRIHDNDGHPHDADKRRAGGKIGEKEIAEVVIKDGAWIGAGAMIMKGVVIEENEIVGAGSVVRRGDAGRACETIEGRA